MVKKKIFSDCHENYWKNHKKIKDSKYVNEIFFEKFFELQDLENFSTEKSRNLGIFEKFRKIAGSWKFFENF